MANAYTNTWLKENAPAKYKAGWRMHPEGGLTPPAHIKPTKTQPPFCSSCGRKEFRFVAACLDNPTYHWECNRCGSLSKAR